MLLDGSAMVVGLTGEPDAAVPAAAPKTVFDRLQGLPAAQNVRHGLFGTSMNTDNEEPVGKTGRHVAEPVFSVTLSEGAADGHSNRHSKLVQPFASGAGGVTSGGLVQPFANNNHHANKMSFNAPPASDGAASRFLYRGDDDDDVDAGAFGGAGAGRGSASGRSFSNGNKQQQFNNHNDGRGGRGSGNRGGAGARAGKHSDNANSRHNSSRGNNSSNHKASTSNKPTAANAGDLDADLDAYFAAK